MDLSLAARIIALLGLVLLVVAGVLYLLDRWDLPLGDLPGDIKLTRGNYTCAVPLLSSLIISLILTLIFNLVNYFLNR